MRILHHLFQQNQEWAERSRAQDPEFFQKLSHQQSPHYLWIGCSDSRVPANQIVGLLPGELFVHRNVANVVVHTDLNCLSTIQYAVDVLRVKHIIVCGHYGCGGVRTVLEDNRSEVPGHVERWLGPLRHLANSRGGELADLETFDLRFARLCEMNVLEQVGRLRSSDVLVNAHLRGIDVAIYGFIYDLRDGLLRDLGSTKV